MEILLNRLRGSDKKAFYIGSYGVSGKLLYILYVTLIVALFAFNQHDYDIAILITICSGLIYYGGQSLGWGEWVGAIENDEHIASIARLEEDEGHDSGIHQIANFIFPESKSYYLYCWLALSIRGLYWWMPLMTIMFYSNIIDTVSYLFSLCILSIGFPLAIEIAKRLTFEFEVTPAFRVKNIWERQEVIYGLFQFIGYTLILIINI